MSCRIGVIIAAGGSSSRMGGIDKLFRLIDGMPVIIKTCLAFLNNSNFSTIVVSIKDESKEKLISLLSQYGIDDRIIVVSGGETRQESVTNAINAMDECEYIAIHDGARPFVTQQLLNNCVDTALNYGSAVPVLASTDTLKQVKNDSVIGTVDRNEIFRVQTPQIFVYKEYVDAIRSVSDLSYTDDSMMMEKNGIKVHVCSGELSNIKLTYEDDFSYADFLTKGIKMYRNGIGYDVHRLVEGRKLTLCGVEIPYEKGLLGHSDADVAIHSLMDAILGAASMGDIGKMFPDNDDRYKDADSVELLKTVVENVNNAGYTIVNADITVIAQRPKLSAYTNEMRRIVSSACGCELDSISIKATTEEGLGFTGEGLGISAISTCTLSK